MRNSFQRFDSPKQPADRLSEVEKQTRWVGAGRPEAVDPVRAAGQFIGDNPLLCLGIALLIGVAAGWWMKRT